MITLAANDAAGIRHAFFTREGGVSAGIFGSAEMRLRLRPTRRRTSPGTAPAPCRRSTSPPTASSPAHQIHSPTVVAVETPWRREANRAPTPW